jgi:Flp pilus assembly protein TadG
MIGIDALSRRLHTMRTDDQGSALQTVIVAPATLLLIALIVTFGVLAQAHQKVEHAANEAARTASIARTAFAAAPDAQAAARNDLTARGLTCSALNVDTDLSGFRSRPGVAASVSATVTCVVSLDALGFPQIVGSRTITATAVSPIDTYRERIR